MDYLKDKLDLPNLTLRVYFADFYSSCYATPFRKNSAAKKEQARYQSHICESFVPWKS